ncbi:DUF3836 domain-containing protein [Parabacteroides sp. OttesenSCG-928-K15]|nr:DUF3836 domain-containing protein [Parabacteroides sp. OttesenSCG-928-K15]
MKKSLFTALLVSVLMVTFVATASAKTESFPKFLYNTTTENGLVLSKQVCKQIETGAYKLHLKYEYTYTDEGMPTSCKALRWNEDTIAWENWYLITYTYDEILSTATLNYALWNKEGNDFDMPREKAVYQYAADASLLNYAQYEKKATESHWEVKLQFGLDSYFLSQIGQ